MMTACVALMVAAASVTGHEAWPTFFEWGGDPARGVLVNLTPGAKPWEAPDPARPTLVFIHGLNPTPRTLHFTMSRRFSEAVARRFGAGFNLLSWDWNAASVVSLRPGVNDENAVQQGFALADALRGAGVDPSRTHLIGHSSGAIVAAAAARALLNEFGRPVAQLTLLEPATLYHSVIFDRLAAGSAAYCVENYWSPGPSGYGRHVNHLGVWNWRVDNPTPYIGLVSPRHSGHLAVMRWYLATIEDPTCAAGFNISLLVRGGS
jgi:pimeloyl-ACP methyl ester carboxylesterase